MKVKLFFVTFNLNCRLDTVFVGKLSERVSNFWMVRFLKTESEPIFGFQHIPAVWPRGIMGPSELLPLRGSGVTVFNVSVTFSPWCINIVVFCFNFLFQKSRRWSHSLLPNIAVDKWPAKAGRVARHRRINMGDWTGTGLLLRSLVAYLVYQGQHVQMYELSLIEYELWWDDNVCVLLVRLLTLMLSLWNVWFVVDSF